MQQRWREDGRGWAVLGGLDKAIRLECRCRKIILLAGALGADHADHEVIASGVLGGNGEALTLEECEVRAAPPVGP